MERMKLFNRMILFNISKDDASYCILSELKNFRFKLSYIEKFCNKYSNISYNNSNIEKHCYLVFYFGLDIEKKFVDHVVDNYVFVKKYCKKILHKIKIFPAIVDKILENLESGNFPMDNQLLTYISSHINIKHLNINNFEYKLSNACKLNLKNLKKLKIASTCTIFSDDIKHMTQLEALFAQSSSINNNCLKYFKQLKYLDYQHNDYICNIGLFDKLTHLALSNENFTHDEINKLPQLIFLKIGRFTSNYGLSTLINLTALDLSDTNNITDDGIKKIETLKFLNVEFHYGGLCKITNEGIKNLKNLVFLNCSNNKYITDDCLQSLVNLKYLNIHNNPSITDKVIIKLNLIGINASHNSKVTNQSIFLQKELKYLTATYNDKINNLSLEILNNLSYVNIENKTTTYNLTQQKIILDDENKIISNVELTTLFFY